MERNPSLVIFDTNVFVGAGFNPRCASAALLRAAEAGALLAIWHETTRAETQRILDKIPRLSFEGFSGLFLPQSEYSGALDLDAVSVVPDPEDRKFAALAVQSGAALVSSDEDLLGVREALAAEIWTPGEAAARLNL